MNVKDFIESHLIHRLEKAHWATENKLHFRCPVCGDSKKDPNKTRGGILVDELGGETRVGFHCF